MSKTTILNHKQLVAQIKQLKTDRINQEAHLTHSVGEFLQAINPITIAKNTLHALAVDSEVHYSLAKVGLNMAANFIIEKVLGKNRSVKGFLSTILVEIMSNAYINQHAPEIITKIKNLIIPQNGEAERRELNMSHEEN